jgi:hypothetical protein
MADTAEPTSRGLGADLDPWGQAITGAGADQVHGAADQPALNPALDEGFAREIADAGIVLDPIQFGIRPLEADVAQKITEARDSAEKAVRATHAKRPVQTKRAIVRLDPADVETLVHQRQHEAVRDTAKDLDVEPAAYYRESPDSIANCTVHCLDEWPELNDAAYSRPGEDRLYSLDEDHLAERDQAEERSLVTEVLEDAGYFDHLVEPAELEELPPDIEHELHMRTPVEPLAADDPAVAQIKAAARSADEAVRAPDAVRAHTEKREQELGPDAPWWGDTTHERAHEAWHWAIRDTCANLGVDPGAYFATEPDEVVKCDFECAEAWPEITTVAVVEYPWDLHLTMRSELEPDTPTAAETQATETQLQDRDEQADWLRLNEHTLDDDPPASDLDSGMGCGY